MKQTFKTSPSCSVCHHAPHPDSTCSAIESSRLCGCAPAPAAHFEFDDVMPWRSVRIRLFILNCVDSFRAWLEGKLFPVAAPGEIRRVVEGKAEKISLPEDGP